MVVELLEQLVAQAVLIRIWGWDPVPQEQRDAIDRFLFEWNTKFADKWANSKLTGLN